MGWGSEGGEEVDSRQLKVEREKRRPTLKNRGWGTRFVVMLEKNQTWELLAERFASGLKKADSKLRLE